MSRPISLFLLGPAFQLPTPIQAMELSEIEYFAEAARKADNRTVKRELGDARHPVAASSSAACPVIDLTESPPRKKARSALDDSQDFGDSEGLGSSADCEHMANWLEETLANVMDDEIA